MLHLCPTETQASLDTLMFNSHCPPQLMQRETKEKHKQKTTVEYLEYMYFSSRLFYFLNKCHENQYENSVFWPLLFEYFTLSLSDIPFTDMSSVCQKENSWKYTMQVEVKEEAGGLTV